MECSCLNGHLFINHLIENSSCSCGAPVEDSYHFFFICPYYHRHRRVLISDVERFCTPTLEVLLYGSATCSPDDNLLILNSVQRYLLESGRFI